MTTVNVLLASLNRGNLQTARKTVANAARAKNLGVEVVTHPTVSIRDVRNSLIGDLLEDPPAVWVLDLLEETRWDLHGEACRRIIEDDDRHPRLHGALVEVTLRYRSDATTALTNASYPRDVVAQLQVEDAPPAVIHAAPFSYDPFHDYYTEAHERLPDP